MELSLVINVHKEPPCQVEACLSRAMANLRPKRTVIFLNGVCRPDLVNLFQKFALEIRHVENYANNQQWCLWWSRMLEWHLSGCGDLLLKIDPDTMVDAPPQSVPTEDYFGDVHLSPVRVAPHTYWISDPVPFVQGGVVGLSRRAVRDLHTTGLLEMPRLQDWCPTISSRMIFMEDHLIAAALRVIGIYPRQWAECKSQWKIPVINCPIKYAIVHPRYYRSYDSK